MSIGHSKSKVGAVVEVLVVEGLVWDDLDVEVGSIFSGRVGDQLREEDFLVGVENVDHQTHELLNVNIEGVGLGALHHDKSGQNQSTH